MGCVNCKCGCSTQEVSKERKLLMEVADSIDWDQQFSSQFLIGEDAAESVLMYLDFDFNEGQCNEAVAKHLASLKAHQDSSK